MIKLTVRCGITTPQVFSPLKVFNYEFKRLHPTKKKWTKYIWSKDIPPSKSFLAWRLMHDKMATDENLMVRGCSIPSMCSLCKQGTENSFHLFFQCTFAINLWKWFASILNFNIQFQTVEDIWSLADRNWNPQCKLTIISTLINILNIIWFSRNQIRFKVKQIPWKQQFQ